MDYLQKDIVFLFKNTTSQKTNLVMVFLKKKKKHVNFPKSLHPSLLETRGLQFKPNLLKKVHVSAILQSTDRRGIKLEKNRES